MYTVYYSNTINTDLRARKEDVKTMEWLVNQVEAKGSCDPYLCSSRGFLDGNGSLAEIRLSNVDVDQSALSILRALQSLKEKRPPYIIQCKFQRSIVPE